MINGGKPGEDIFLGDEDIIVFAINAEGFNDSGFAGLVSRKGWPELANMGECKLGSVFTKEINGKRFCGIVCHSLENGWGTPEEQTAIIKKCFDKIETKEGEKIASIAIGNGLIGQLSGADFEAITLGMSQSEKDIILYGEVPEKVLQAQRESKSKEKTVEKENDKMKKLDLPYYKVAKEALMNWNGLSEEEAEKIIVESTFDEVEGQVWAKGSIDYAIAEISKALSLTEGDVEKITKEIYEGSDTSHVLRALKPEIERIGANPDEIIMDTLFAVHNGWVKDNEKKFMAREKKHQHMPSELIGWKEAKADLLFVKPIFEAAGIEVSEERLESVYNSRVEEFFLMKGIRTKEDLVREVAKGEEFYPALKGQDTILEFLKDEENIKNILIPQIEDKGIGSIENTYEVIIKKIEEESKQEEEKFYEEPKYEDLEKLDEIELEKICEDLDSKIKSAIAKRDSIKETNKLINEILLKSQRLSSIKKEIAEEEIKRNNLKLKPEEE